MPWYAKPDYGYAINSTEGTANILMINGFLNQYNYQLAAQAALIACVANEGALNPWLWGYGHPAMTPNVYQGYGLFQFTEWDKYVDNPNATGLEGYGPNKSRDYETPGAKNTDGWAQLLFFNNGLGGWDSNIWRFSSWNPSSYPTEYAAYEGLMSRWGVNGLVTQERFKQITNIPDAVIAFLGGYEGPVNPGYYSNAVDIATNQIWGIISGDTPPTPPTPTPTGRRRSMPLWMYLKRY